MNFSKKYFYGALLIYVLNCFLNLVQVQLQTYPAIMLFLFGLGWSVTTGLIIATFPYDTRLKNVRSMALGIASLTHSTVLLASNVGFGGADSGYLYALLVLLFLMSLWWGVQHMFHSSRYRIHAKSADVLSFEPTHVHMGDTVEASASNSNVETRVRIQNGEKQNGRPIGEEPKSSSLDPRLLPNGAPSSNAPDQPEKTASAATELHGNNLPVVRSPTSMSIGPPPVDSGSSRSSDLSPPALASPVSASAASAGATVADLVERRASVNKKLKKSSSKSPSLKGDIDAAALQSRTAGTVVASVPESLEGLQAETATASDGDTAQQVEAALPGTPSNSAPRGAELLAKSGPQAAPSIDAGQSAVANLSLSRRISAAGVSSSMVAAAASPPAVGKRRSTPSVSQTSNVPAAGQRQPPAASAARTVAANPLVSRPSKAK
jgi:hypothetical protein